ncbi:SIT4 phosphatase-associated protein-domain-containing protein [Lipomyces kononenkoae]|uniref:SIT4 phosphatase-associated protein-domain-containing protein n=1 Tax=Lipomyces kononenkoae TaxID=34357 RepID=A0ACC3T4M5_LIPKO
MAFWRVSTNFASLNAVSGVNKLLEKPDCSIAELLEEDDILQELREHNAKLIEYLREPRILQQLLRYISHWTPSRVGSTSTESTSSSSVSGDGDEDRSCEAEFSDGDATPTDKSVEVAPGTQIDMQGTVNEEAVDEGNTLPEDDLEREDEDLGLTRIAASPEPDSSGIFDDEKAWRYARLSSEVFSSEIWSIYETVLKETALLDEFWTFLDKPAPLDPVYAGYFTKTNEQFLERKTEQMIEFLKTQPELVARFMRHIDTPSIMDLLLKILCTDKPDNPTGIIEFLQSQKLIPSLISFLSVETASNTQSAAGDFLKALITISANASNDYTSIGPNELTRELVSPQIVTQLADQMVTSGGTALATAVGVIIELIRKNNSDYDMVSMMSMTLESHPPNTRDPIYLGYLLKILAQTIPRFQQLLVKRRDIRLQTSFGDIEPLGFERFKICELVAELLHCSNMALLNNPRGEEVAMQRDAIRKQNKLAWANDVRNSFTYSEGGIQDLGTSVNELSVDDQHPTSESPSESRGWWGLGKKKTSASTSPRKDTDILSATIEEDNDEADDLEDIENVGSFHPVDEPIAPDTPIEALDEQPEEDEDESDTMLTPQVRRSPEVTGELKMEELTANEKELVVGDFLKYQLIHCRVVSTIIDLFFRFPWNNFLHNVVFDIIQQIFNGPIDRDYNRLLAIELFRTDHITDQIVAGTKTSNDHELATHMRLGYMGHLTLISEEIVKFLQRYPPETLAPEVVEETVNSESWNHYVNETLMQIRIRDNSILGGQRPASDIPSHHHHLLTMGGMEDLAGASPEEDDDDGDVAAEFSNDDGLTIDEKDDEVEDDAMNARPDARIGLGQSNDQWTRYMSQQMTPDRFGSSDEDDEDEEIEEPEEEADEDNVVCSSR